MEFPCPINRGKDVIQCYQFCSAAHLSGDCRVVENQFCVNFDVVHSDRCEHSTLRADKNFILIVQVNSVNYGSKIVLIIPSSQRVERRVIKIRQNPT